MDVQRCLCILFFFYDKAIVGMYDLSMDNDSFYPYSLQLCDFGLARKLSDISKTPSSSVCLYQLFQQIVLNI